LPTIEEARIEPREQYKEPGKEQLNDTAKFFIRVGCQAAVVLVRSDQSVMANMAKYPMSHVPLPCMHNTFLKLYT
jgi:hypothetical protein